VHGLSVKAAWAESDGLVGVPGYECVVERYVCVPVVSALSGSREGKWQGAGSV
jgi:hypothetical protein